MKKLFYFIYAVFFTVFRLFPVNKKRVSLISPHNASFNDSLFYMEEEFKKHGDYLFNRVSGEDLKSAGKALMFFTKKAYLTATSKFVFLNDNFMPFSMVRFSKKTKVVQLWHGEGVFKKFGLDTDLPEKVRISAEKCAKRYTHIAVSSENVKKFYMSAFGAKEEKIIVTGIPESDGFLRERDLSQVIKKLCLTGDKKTVLYAPTFRENEKGDKELLKHFDFDSFNRELGDRYRLLVRLHPQVHSAPLPEGVTDVTGYEDVNDIIRLADILITDYSSVCMEFALLDKPMIFYAYDLEEYERERSFYFPYESYVPGKVAHNFEELTECLKNESFDREKIEKFRKFNFDFHDGKCSERIFNMLNK